MISEAEKMELLLSINNFDQPATLSGINAAAKLLLNLILMKPGTIPSSPEMGVNLAKYRFDEIDESLLTNMQTDIHSQINLYLPDVRIDEMSIKHFAKNTIRVGFVISSGSESGIVVMDVNNSDISLSQITAVLPQ